MPSDEFCGYVSDTLRGENMGAETAIREWGRTPQGREFVIITTSVGFSTDSRNLNLIIKFRFYGTRSVSSSVAKALFIMNNL